MEKLLDDLSVLDKSKCVEDMVNVGRVEVEKAWRHQIKKYHLKKSGLMGNNITSSAPKLNTLGCFSTIYPQGWEYYKTGKNKGKKRVRNAAKAFMLHYGFYNVRTNQRYEEAMGWVDDVEKEGTETAYKKMYKVYEMYIDKISK